MIGLETTLTLPFRQIPDGTIRIADTRISLETIVDSYRLGQRAEEIHSGFPSISLADIHAIIAYYLKNREAVESYLAVQEADSQRMTNIEFGQTMLKLAGEVAKEQGTRTTEEINQLVNLMRGSDPVNADLS